MGSGGGMGRLESGEERSDGLSTSNKNIIKIVGPFRSVVDCTVYNSIGAW